MAYTTINKSTAHFNTKIYTGTGSSNAITGINFQPDLTWIKNRTSAYWHQKYDVIRGVNKSLASNATNAQENRTDNFNSFNTDGFTVGAEGGEKNVNYSGDNYVSWNWKANGAGSANTDGSISSTVSANTTAGFSIVSYTGTGANATVGHGLGSVPKWIIMKNRSISANWQIYHESIGNTDHMIFTNSAKLDDAGAFNDTSPTSSVFSLGASNYGNGNGNDMIAYCFAEKKGYSKFGSYTGNANADGPFIFTGFKPSFIIIKNSSSAHNWTMIDNKRLGYNDKNYILFPDLNNVEPTTSETDILSNGFKIRASANGVNQSGNTMIYMAFGQSIVGSNNVPCTAR